jgi:hypothetical protein
MAGSLLGQPLYEMIALGCLLLWNIYVPYQHVVSLVLAAGLLLLSLAHLGPAPLSMPLLAMLALTPLLGAFFYGSFSLYPPFTQRDLQHMDALVARLEAKVRAMESRLRTALGPTGQGALHLDVVVAGVDWRGRPKVLLRHNGQPITDSLSSTLQRFLDRQPRMRLLAWRRDPHLVSLSLPPESAHATMQRLARS